MALEARTRIGLIGLNERATRLLLPGLAASPRATVTALCSRDLAKARRVAADLGPGVASFDDVQGLVRSGAVDAVYVNTPATHHVEACMAAIEQGCAVICEKPLGETTEQARRLLREATARSIPAVVNFTYRSTLAYRQTQRLLTECSLGVPLHAEFGLFQGHNYAPGFRRGPALRDSGAHLFDALLGLTALAGFGTLLELCAAPMIEPGGTLDHGWGFMARTARGAVISAAFSRASLGWRNGWRWLLSGDSAAVDVESDGGRAIIRQAVRGDSQRGSTWRVVPPSSDLATDDARFPAYHMDRLVGAARGEERFSGFADALAAHVLADALVQSAATRSWFALPAPDVDGQRLAATSGRAQGSGPRSTT